MNNELFYCLWALPLLAAVLNKAAAVLTMQNI